MQLTGKVSWICAGIRMKGFETTYISSNFQVVIQPSNKVFSDEIQKTVDAIWEDAKKSQAWLFNGLFLSYLKFEKNILYGEFVEYKYFFARTVHPSLQQEIEVYPIGVMGVTKWKDKLLIGKRTNTVTLYKGLYENVPAGSLDPQVVENGAINLKKQYLLELDEEAGIGSEKVQNVRPLYLIHDNNDFLVEIIAEIELFESVSNETNLSTKEYSLLNWIDRSDILLHLRQHENEYVPIVHHIFDLYFEST